MPYHDERRWRRKQRTGKRRRDGASLRAACATWGESSTIQATQPRQAARRRRQAARRTAREASDRSSSYALAARGDSHGLSVRKPQCVHLRLSVAVVQQLAAKLHVTAICTRRSVPPFVRGERSDVKQRVSEPFIVSFSRWYLRPEQGFHRSGSRRISLRRLHSRPSVGGVQGFHSEAAQSSAQWPRRQSSDALLGKEGDNLSEMLRVACGLDLYKLGEF